MGDVVEALSAIEKDYAGRADLLVFGAEMVDEVQELIAGGPIKSLRFKHGNKLLTETSIKSGLTAAVALARGLADKYSSKLVVEVDKGEKGATN